MSLEKCYGEENQLVGSCLSDGSEEIRLAGRMACAACIGRHIAELERQATTDYLTGLPNERVLAKEFEKLKDSGTPFGAIFIDLIHFKRVNDARSHGFGDRMLQLTAEFLRGSGRPEDIVGATAGRKGGDEFVILVPLEARENYDLSDEQRLEAISQRLIADFGEQDLVTAYNRTVRDGKTLGLRAGTALYRPDSPTPMTYEDLRDEADPPKGISSLER